MALLWMEGWDRYSDKADIFADTRYHSEIDSTATLVTGRLGTGQALELDGSSIEIGNVLPHVSTSTVYGGFAIYIKSSMTGPGNYLLLNFYGETNPTDYVFQLYVHGGDNKVWVGRNSTTPLVYSVALDRDKWHYINYKVVISNTAGEAYIYTDGVLSDSVTGVDTSNSAGGLEVRRINIEGQGSLKIQLDDMFFGDDSGTDMTDHTGELLIETLSPDGAGSSTQFTPSAGSNYQNVDDTTPDDDTTYNSSTTTAHKDLFSCGNMTATTGSVYAVQVGSVAKKDSAGYSGLTNKVLSSATEGDGSGGGAEYNVYSSHVDIFENDPNGGGAWSVSAVNSIEIGYELG